MYFMVKILCEIALSTYRKMKTKCYLPFLLVLLCSIFPKKTRCMTWYQWGADRFEVDSEPCDCYEDMYVEDKYICTFNFAWSGRRLVGLMDMACFFNDFQVNENDSCGKFEFDDGMDGMKMHQKDGNIDIYSVITAANQSCNYSRLIIPVMESGNMSSVNISLYEHDNPEDEFNLNYGDIENSDSCSARPECSASERTTATGAITTAHSPGSTVIGITTTAHSPGSTVIGTTTTAPSSAYYRYYKDARIAVIIGVIVVIVFLIAIVLVIVRCRRMSYITNSKSGDTENGGPSTPTMIENTAYGGVGNGTTESNNKPVYAKPNKGIRKNADENGMTSRAYNDSGYEEPPGRQPPRNSGYEEATLSPISRTDDGCEMAPITPPRPRSAQLTSTPFGANTGYEEARTPGTDASGYEDNFVTPATGMTKMSNSGYEDNFVTPGDTSGYEDNFVTPPTGTKESVKYDHLQRKLDLDDTNGSGKADVEAAPGYGQVQRQSELVDPEDYQHLTHDKKPSSAEPGYGKLKKGPKS